MKILQFTDIHLTKAGETIGGRDPIANFCKGLAHAMEQHADAEALFITGDLSDWGDAEDYARLREILREVPVPVHPLIGNHDNRSRMLAVFPERADPNGFVQYTVPLSLGTAICLDSCGPESHAGHFCEARAHWLQTQLAVAEGPVWLFLHHNPVALQIASMDQIMLLDADRFADTIAPFAAKIRHIFHGHCHLPLSGSLLGIPLSAPRGTNHAAWPDFSGGAVLTSAALPEAYAVTFATGTTTLTHMVEFGYGGDIKFEGSPNYADWNRDTMVR